MVAESGVVAVIASVGAFGMGFVASAGAVRAREKSRAAAPGFPLGGRSGWPSWGQGRLGRGGLIC